MDVGILREVITPRAQRALLDYWMTIRGDRPLPSRADIRPEDIGARVLPHVGLIDVLEGAAHFRYRLVGTAMNELYRRDYTGHVVDDVKAPGYAGTLLTEYRHCARGTARYFEATQRFAAGHLRRTCRLLLPLARDGRRIDMILFSTMAAPDDDVPVRLLRELTGDAVVAIEPGYTVHAVALSGVGAGFRLPAPGSSAPGSSGPGSSALEAPVAGNDTDRVPATLALRG